MIAAADSTLDRADVRTTGRWFGPAERPLLGWVTSPASGYSAGGALILPPLGYEYVTTHRTLRTLAEELARAGWTALRLDYDGTGDSAGDQWDAGRVAAWRESAARGAEELRSMGFEEVSVIGLRFGATLALLEASRMRAARVVAWAPVASGRRYVRELRMLGIPVEPSAVCPDPDGAITVGGFVFDAGTLHDLGAIDLATLDASPEASLLVIGRPDGPSLNPLAERLRDIGSDVDVRASDGSQQCLDEPAEYATVPDAIVQEIVEWFPAVSSTPPVARDAADEVRRERAQILHEGIAISEVVTRFGSRDLVGIVGIEGSRPEAARATVIWANSGSETHIGPGRAWVEYSRTLNRAGFRTIRLDARGWGESPDDDLAPARPYDAHMADDLRAVVADVEARGWGPVVLAGLCAGAWMALDVARTTPLGGVIACNPQLYWQPGDPVEANIVTETHARREAERKRLKRLGRYGVWSILDALGARSPAARCLHDVSERGTPTLLLFGRGDDGLEYLEDRVGRGLDRSRRAGRIEVVELPSIDHGMHRVWLRHEVIDAMVSFLDPLVPARA
jgi:alpha-beta hydrolase superfamily lysophospholipase